FCIFDLIPRIKTKQTTKTNKQIFAGETAQSTSSKRNTISLAIRRLTLAVPKLDADVYTKQVVKPFHFHSGQLQITATLPKEIFFHGESIEIHLTIDNASSNVVRRLKLQVIQTVEITLFKQRTTRCTIIDMEVDKGFPIESQTAGWSQSYHLRPSLQDTRQQAGLALDGKLKHHDTNLASSTLIKDYRKKESMGIVVQYMVCVRRNLVLVYFIIIFYQILVCTELDGLVTGIHYELTMVRE
ncbi:unnamed protein product, partial [Trichobilharzia regenti]